MVLFDYLTEDCKNLASLEQDQMYHVLHPDGDSAAVANLKRFSELGVNHIIFAWPCFWWFDYYPGLNNYLRGNFKCSLENDRLVIFDLKK